MIREAVTDSELETWTRVRNTVEIDNPTTVEDARTAIERQPELRYWLAELDREPVGCVFVAHSSVPGRAFALPRVVPGARRRGAGTALLEAALAYARELGREVVRSHVDGPDPGGLRFAQRHDFVEVDRQVELVRPLAAQEPTPATGSGIELADFTPDRIGELRAIVERGVEDMPVAGGLADDFPDELLEELESAVYRVVALDAGRVVGLAGLMRYGAREDALEHAFTTVLRSHRGRGIAQALKQACVHWGAGQGYAELITWTQHGNDAMQAVNERVGFRPGRVSITVERPLA